MSTNLTEKKQSPSNSLTRRGKLNHFIVQLASLFSVLYCRNTLFRTYCMPMYVCQLWWKYTVFIGDRNDLSKCNDTSLHNHHQNTPKRRFMTIFAFKWNSCGFSKCLNGHQGQTLKKPVRTHTDSLWIRTEVMYC